MSTAATLRRTPRQARGQLRIDTILEAAAQVLVEVGIEAATTNAIAARAHTSIGSLYQFFPNKEAVFHALGLRYLERMRERFAPLLSAAAAELSLDEQIGRAVEALDSMQRESPAFKVLFCSPLLAPKLANADMAMHRQLVQGLEASFAVRRPDLDPARRTLMARICVLTAEGLMPLLAESAGEARTQVLDELKALLLGYLRPVFA